MRNSRYPKNTLKAISIKSKKNSISKIILSIGMLFITYNSFSQTKTDSLYQVWQNTKIADSSRAKAYNQYILDSYVYNYPDSAFMKTEELYKFTQDKELLKQQANALKTFGEIYNSTDNKLESIDYYQKSLDIYKTIDDKKGIAGIFNNMGILYTKNYNFDAANKYFNKALDLAKEIDDKKLEAIVLTSIGNVYLFRFKVEEALPYYEQSLKITDSINDLERTAINKVNIGFCNIWQKKYEIAIQHLNESLAIFKKLSNRNRIAGTYTALTMAYNRKGDYNKAITFGKKALKLWEELGNKKELQKINLEFRLIYKNLNNYKLALKYYEKANEISNQLYHDKTRKRLDWLEYKKNKKTDSLVNIEKQLKLELKHQKEIQEKEKTSVKLAFGWAISLLSISLIALIIYKNTKRKQLQAEQEKEIELQKKEKLLKNIELSTIDAMIEGQEKERQIIANDLHDDLGALMTTIKLNINALKEKNTPELLESTNQLIDRAYNKIRGFAHVKHSGVIGKKGLLVAVQNMANKISETNQLQIDVLDHGLDERLENSLELTLFRIIQELITNIIKHAQATEATIHLTNHKDKLNIMVEDNGIGFNTKNIKKGMGINTIEKRINHLDGTLTIDDSSKGTTIIIDIPL